MKLYMSEYFEVRNPSHLDDYGISTIPIPFQAKHGAERGSGPVHDMCYILFERNHTVGRDDAVENPTEDNHVGWNMRGEGIFKGWEESSGEQKGGVRNLWRPILHAREYPSNRILNSDDERQLIKFERVYRAMWSRYDPDIYIGDRATDKIMNNLCWVECEYYTHPITRKQGDAKLKMLSTGKNRSIEKLPKELQSKILSTNLPKNVTPPRPSTPDILLNRGGKRKTRRRRNKRRRKSRRKRKTRRRKNKKRRKTRKNRN